MDIGVCLKNIWVRFMAPGACLVDLLARSVALTGPWGLLHEHLGLLRGPKGLLYGPPDRTVAHNGLWGLLKKHLGSLR